MKKTVLSLVIAISFSGCFLYNENYNAGQAALKIGDVTAAKEQFKIGCDTGNDRYSCYNFSYYAHEDKDYEQALPYAKKACDLGNYKGCAALAYMYEMGEGVQQSYSKAIPY
ncbi:MAG: hypothetical protein LBC08_00615, partial [Campylobacteraceae bacterium]|nr:hypothetical protein [Campylobacteraceae bacterium]